MGEDPALPALHRLHRLRLHYQHRLHRLHHLPAGMFWQGKTAAEHHPLCSCYHAASSKLCQLLSVLPEM